MRDHARSRFSCFPVTHVEVAIDGAKIKVAIGGAKSKLLSAVLKLLSAVLKLLSAVLKLLSAVLKLLSAVLKLLIGDERQRLKSDSLGHYKCLLYLGYTPRWRCIWEFKHRGRSPRCTNSHIHRQRGV